MPRSFRRVAAAALLLNVLSGCAPSSPPVTGPAPATGAALRPKPTPADIAFMRDMIGHHAQALVMARLLPGRSERADLGILAERIIVSQQDEIDIMRQWLRDQGAPVPDTAAHDHAGMAMPSMPGMATPEQLKALEAKRGVEFEREFLTLMITHHTGAITMVERLFATHGAGQDDFIFKFASDVAADQESEIARMRSILATMTPTTARP